MMMMMMRMINSSYKSNEFGSFRMWQKHYQNKAIYWRETLKISILEQNAEIVPSALRVRCGQYFLMQIGTFSGFAAIFLTANALCSPVRKENPASRACGKKRLPHHRTPRLPRRRKPRFSLKGVPATADQPRTPRPRRRNISADKGGTMWGQSNWLGILFPKSRPWDPSKIVDLAICYKFHQSRAPETFIRPTWWKN